MGLSRVPEYRCGAAAARDLTGCSGGQPLRVG